MDFSVGLLRRGIVGLRAISRKPLAVADFSKAAMQAREDDDTLGNTALLVENACYVSQGKAWPRRFPDSVSIASDSSYLYSAPSLSPASSITVAISSEAIAISGLRLSHSGWRELHRIIFWPGPICLCNA
jgi:hypothetical protein